MAQMTDFGGHECSVTSFVAEPKPRPLKIYKREAGNPDCRAVSLHATPHGGVSSAECMCSALSTLCSQAEEVNRSVLECHSLSASFCQETRTNPCAVSFALYDRILRPSIPVARSWVEHRDFSTFRTARTEHPPAPLSAEW